MTANGASPIESYNPGHTQHKPCETICAALPARARTFRRCARRRCLIDDKVQEIPPLAVGGARGVRAPVRCLTPGRRGDFRARGRSPRRGVGVVCARACWGHVEAQGGGCETGPVACGPRPFTMGLSLPRHRIEPHSNDRGTPHPFRGSCRSAHPSGPKLTDLAPHLVEIGPISAAIRPTSENSWHDFDRCCTNVDRCRTKLAPTAPKLARC